MVTSSSSLSLHDSFEFSVETKVKNSLSVYEDSSLACSQIFYTNHPTTLFIKHFMPFTLKQCFLCKDEDDNDGSVGCGGGDVKLREMKILAKKITTKMMMVIMTTTMMIITVMMTLRSYKKYGQDAGLC